MEKRERRNHLRLRWSFPVSLCKPGLEHWLKGTSVNVSQMGAFIRTESWHLFALEEQTVVVWTLPGEFTGQGKTIRLQGNAVIRRIDQASGGVALEFLKQFRAFERVNG